MIASRVCKVMIIDEKLEKEKRKKMFFSLIAHHRKEL